jgi:hypothetical protein
MDAMDRFASMRRTAPHGSHLFLWVQILRADMHLVVQVDLGYSKGVPDGYWTRQTQKITPSHASQIISVQRDPIACARLFRLTGGVVGMCRGRSHVG